MNILGKKTITYRRYASRI